MPETEVGRVSHFFSRVSVAGIELTDELSVGDTIRVQGHTTDFTCSIDSMQVENEQVELAGQGRSVGIKVPDRCREGDRVFKVT